jgi:hypothetical protein
MKNLGGGSGPLFPLDGPEASLKHRKWLRLNGVLKKPITARVAVSRASVDDLRSSFDYGLASEIRGDVDFGWWQALPSYGSCARAPTGRIDIGFSVFLTVGA